MKSIRAVFVVVALLFILLATPVLWYSFAVHPRVFSQARKLADGRPYCILVAKKQGAFELEYEEADSFIDTMGLLMVGGKARNHAVLVIGYRENPVHYHWSYWNYSFMKGSLGPYGNTTCAQYKFDYDNIQPADYMETRRIRFNGATYRIPLVYQPSASNDDKDRNAYAKSFTVIVALPEFKPVKDWCSNGVCHYVGVEEASELDVDRSDAAVKGAYLARSRTLYGLLPGAGKHHYGKVDKGGDDDPYGVYYAVGDHGEVSTQVMCSAWCTVTFNHDGVQYSFGMLPKDLAHWQRYEKGVVDFFERYKEPAPACLSVHATRYPPAGRKTWIAPALWLSPNSPRRWLAEDAQVVMVSGYEAPRGGVNVHVDLPGRKVLLVLSGPREALWTVTASSGTNVVGIVASIPQPTVATRLCTRGYQMYLGGPAQRARSRHFVDTLKRLHGAFGIDHVDYLHAGHRLPARVRIDQLDTSDPTLSLRWPPVQAPDANFHFMLPVRHGGKAAWSLTGSLDGRASMPLHYRRSITLSDGRVYVMDGSAIIVTMPDAAGKSSIAIPAHFPQAGHFRVMAYDSTRGLIAVVTDQGDGYLYRFDVAHGRWLDFHSLRDADIFSMSYDPLADRYVAWSRWFEKLVFISAGGQRLFTSAVSDKLIGLDRVDAHSPPLHVVARGDQVALILPAFRGNYVQRIWCYDVAHDRARLTYKAATRR